MGSVRARSGRGGESRADGVQGSRSFLRGDGVVLLAQGQVLRVAMGIKRIRHICMSLKSVCCPPAKGKWLKEHPTDSCSLTCFAMGRIQTFFILGRLQEDQKMQGY